MNKLPTEEQYNQALDYFFKNIDESFTYGSDNEDIGDWLREGFDEFWCSYVGQGERAPYKGIVELAYQMQDELYSREALHDE